LINFARSALHQLGIDVVRYREASPEYELHDTLTLLGTLRDLVARTANSEEAEFISYCMSHYSLSKAQLFQDLFVQYVLGQKRGGFFVEFGATNGIHLSNSYSLEKHYAWDGILAEPANFWHAELKNNRNCRLDFRCVWESDGQQLRFNEVAHAELSTIDSFSANDMHAKTREIGNVYTVDTVSLNSLLAEHRAPGLIDYLSIDTEGSELKILSAFDFGRHKIKIITVEHNNTADRPAIQSLLSANGYTRRFETLSRWDDWYVSR
jgi:FkbM family methyltransferase